MSVWDYLCTPVCNNPIKEERNMETTTQSKLSYTYKNTNLFISSKKLMSLPGSPRYNADSSKLSFSQKSTFATESCVTRKNSMNNDLLLEVIESDYLSVGTTFVFDSFCNLNGQPTQEKNSIIIGTKEIGNICSTDIMVGAEKPVPKGNKHAKITQDKDVGTVIIEDLGSSDGIYVKIDQKTKLRENILYLGACHIHCNVVETEKKKKSVALKLIDGSSNEFSMIFEEKTKITIGRSPTCTIQIDEVGLSRVQSTIFFEDGEWYIVDGDGKKPSTNSSWFLLEEKFESDRDVVFKVRKTLFKATIVSC